MCLITEKTLQGPVFSLLLIGYPLPTLLRLALLILHNPPYEPIDVILSYSHLNLQNATFLEFAPQLYEKAKVEQLIAASPLSMGLLTPKPPSWHPAPPGLLKAVRDASAGLPAAGDFPNLALGYSIRRTGARFGNTPLVVGFSTLKEVHEAIKVWREIQTGAGADGRKEAEEAARTVFEQAGYLNWSWSSP